MKKLNAKRLISLVLATVMLLSLGLTGCTPSETTGNSDNGTTSKPDGTSIPDGAVLYTITAKGQGGMLLPGVTITMTDMQGLEVASGTANDDGQFSAWLYPAEYTVKITDGLAEGYTAVESKTTTEGGMFYAVANTAVITEHYPSQPNGYYTVGSVMYDFAYADENGQEVRLSELLETKKLVIINFWATYCSPCVREFPAIQEAYEEYSDDVAIVAFGNDATSTSLIEKFKEKYSLTDLTFDMVPNIGLYPYFKNFHNGAGVPCTIFIDRYGVVTYGITGGEYSASAWKEIMEIFTADDYSQNDKFDNDVEDDQPVQEKPDVEMPASSAIEAAVNGTNSDGTKFNGTYYASEGEYIWPWVVTEDGNAIEPSNYGKDSTNAMIYTTLNFQKGQVFAFDYEYSIDYDYYGTQIYDYLAVYVDGHVMQKMYTKQNGKVTCYAYTPVEAGEHEITLVYVKDSSTWAMMGDEEYVRVSNLRMVSVEDMTKAGGSLNVWTPAADTVNKAENPTTSYLNYVTVVLGSDGYYRVGSVDGPLLLTKLSGSSQWSSNSLYELGSAGYLKIDGTNYYEQLAGDGEHNTRNDMWMESYSSLGYTPVNERIADLLDLFAERVGDGPNHEWEWLEFCCYFTHYGVGDGITKVTDVRQGIDADSAFIANEGVNTAIVNQTLVPRGLYFKFVPEKSGVYYIYSISDGAETTAAGGIVETDCWILNANDEEIDWSQEGASGHFKVYENMKAGETYYILVAFASTEDLGKFNFMIDYIGEDNGTYDIMTECTLGHTTDLKTEEIIIDRNYGFKAELGEDGYYHQVLSDGSLDMGEHGYVYIDFLNSSELLSYIPYKGDFCTLKNYIEKGYVVRSSSGELVYVENAFDFTKRTDDEGNSLAAFGNYQAEMEAYLKQATEGKEKTDFDYGYVKADEKLVEIINILVQLYGEPCEDDWLTAASFAKHP